MEALESALIGAAAKDVITPAREIVSRIGAAGYNKLAAAFSRTFQGHVDGTLNRCSRIKNILYRDQSVLLIDQYVNVRFSQANDQRRAINLADQEIVDNLLVGKKYIISGTAGAGKTMFMKWACLALIKAIPKSGIIPLFLELRYVNEKDVEDPLEATLLNRTSSIKDRSTHLQFIEGLKVGHFAIVLDALDEVNSALRDRMISRIREFILQFPKCPVILSTRPSTHAESMQEMAVLRSLPMTGSQIKQVLTKLDYDYEVKSRLIEDLDAKLFKSHGEFLSNPLLATIMLLTYDHAADIPAKMSSFYKLAFETLYQRHDAAKGAYKRAHYAKLPMDDFSRLFSVFCYESYIEDKYEFSEEDLLSFIRRAIEYVGLSTSPESYAYDLTESVCLIQKEGLDNVFVHRSFQEYFAALFVSNYRDEDVSERISSVYHDDYDSPILVMLFELNQDLLELSWIIPTLGKFLGEMKGVDVRTRGGLRDFINRTWREFDVNIDTGNIEGVTLYSGTMGTWLSILDRYYSGKTIDHHLFASDDIAKGSGVSALSDHPLYGKLQSLKSAIENAGPIGGPEDDDDTIVVSVDAEDADWLIATPLPYRFERVLDAIRKFQDELIKKHANRRAAIKRFAK